MEYKQNNKILVLVPTYNNESTILKIADQINKKKLDMLIINDGSTDSTKVLLESSIYNHLNLKENSGKGSAIKVGAKYASSNQYTHIITIDADMQHLVADLNKFITEIDKYPDSIIVGCRNFNSNDIPNSSKFGRKFSNFWIKIASGEKLSDSQSGFRAYPLKYFTKLKTKYKRYNFEMEILVRASWAGIPIREIDIEVNYSPETIKASHFKPFLDNFRISVTFTNLVTRNFLPIPHNKLHGQTGSEKFKEYISSPIKTFKELIHEKTKPSELAFASFVGIFFGTLPFVATHSIVIIFAATRLKLNRIMALSVSNLCMPPIVPAVCVEVGYFVLHGKFLTNITIQTIGYQFLDRVGDYLLGTVILAPILGIIIAAIVYLASVSIYFFKKNKCN